jgi:hypothetical protein
MRIVIFSVGLIIAGCASNPTGTAPATRAAAAPGTAAPATAVAAAPATAPAPADKTAEATAKKIAEARKLGYNVVNENGETMYCHKEARVGSHLATETSCLTEAQVDELRRRTQENMRTFQMQLPPPQGK